MPKVSASLVASFQACSIVNSVSLFVDDEEVCAVVVPERDEEVIAVLEAVFDRNVPVAVGAMTHETRFTSVKKVLIVPLLILDEFTSCWTLRTALWLAQRACSWPAQKEDKSAAPYVGRRVHQPGRTLHVQSRRISRTESRPPRRSLRQFLRPVAADVQKLAVVLKPLSTTAGFLRAATTLSDAA